MLRVVRIDNHTVKHRASLKQRPELLPPQHRTVIDMVPDRSVVVFPSAHVVGRQGLGKVYTGLQSVYATTPRLLTAYIRSAREQRILCKGSPRAFHLILINPLLIHTNPRHPVIQQRIVSTSPLARLGRRVPARHKVRVRGDIVHAVVYLLAGGGTAAPMLLRGGCGGGQKEEHGPEPEQRRGEEDDEITGESASLRGFLCRLGAVVVGDEAAGLAGAGWVVGVLVQERPVFGFVLHGGRCGRAAAAAAAARTQERRGED